MSYIRPFCKLVDHEVILRQQRNTSPECSDLLEGRRMNCNAKSTHEMQFPKRSIVTTRRWLSGIVGALNLLIALIIVIASSEASPFLASPFFKIILISSGIGVMTAALATLGSYFLKFRQTAVLQDDRVAIQKGKERLILPLSAIEKIDDKLYIKKAGLSNTHHLDLYYSLHEQTQKIRLTDRKFLSLSILKDFEAFIHALRERKQQLKFDPSAAPIQAHLLTWTQRNRWNSLIFALVFFTVSMPLFYNDWGAILFERKKVICTRTWASRSSKGSIKYKAEFDIDGEKEYYTMPSSQSVTQGEVKEWEHWKGALWGQGYRIIW